MAPAFEGSIPSSHPENLMEENEFYWLAGILEGEGSFLHGPPSNPTSPAICIQMTDEDIIAKVARLFNRKYHKVKSKRYIENNWKPPFVTKIAGREAVDLMIKLKPLMGIRRANQIDEVVSKYKSIIVKNRNFRLLIEDVRNIKKLLVEGELTHKEIADIYGVERSSITYIHTGKSWAHIE